MRTLVAVLGWGFLPLTAAAQETPIPDPTGSESVTQESPRGAADAAQDFLRRLAEEGIELDMEAREVRVPGVLLRFRPSAEYPVEYSLVTEQGFTHEALGVLKCTPSLLNACLLALGLERGQSRAVEPADPQPPEDDIRMGLEDPWQVFPPSGQRVFCYVGWQDEQGAETLLALEDMLMDLRTGEPLPLRGFVYTGSRFVEHTFGNERRNVYIADYEGNIATIYPDRGAAQNCLFDVYSRDQEAYRWADVNPDRVPTPDTPVQFIFSPVHRDGMRAVDPDREPVKTPLEPADEYKERTRNPYLREADDGLLARVGARTTEDYRRMLKQGQEPLREIVCGVLGTAATDDATTLLGQTVRFDRSDDVRLAAAYGLAEIGGREAVDELIAILSDRWWKAREDALFALRLLSGVDHGRDASAWQRWADANL